MPNSKVIPYEAATGKLKDVYERLIEKRGRLAAVPTIQSLNLDSIIAHMELYMTMYVQPKPLIKGTKENDSCSGIGSKWLSILPAASWSSFK